MVSLQQLFPQSALPEKVTIHIRSHYTIAQIIKQHRVTTLMEHFLLQNADPIGLLQKCVSITIHFVWQQEQKPSLQQTDKQNDTIIVFQRQKGRRDLCFLGSSPSTKQLCTMACYFVPIDVTSDGKGYQLNL